MIKIFNKRLIIIVLLFTLVMNVQCQQIDENSDSYKRGEAILKNAKEQIKDDGGKMNYSDYWNFAIAYALMNKDSDTILNYLRKCKEGNLSSFLLYTKELINHSGSIEKTMFYKILKDDYISLINDAKEKLRDAEITNGEKVENIKNKEVVKILKEMMEKDQFYRSHNDFLTNKKSQKLQTVLDNENIKKLESIFYDYGYPGESIVGDNEYKDFACIILTHAQSINIKKKWVGEITKAAIEGELNINTVKILIDKIQLQETGKQIFGSQAGIPFEDENTIKIIRKKYGF